MLFLRNIVLLALVWTVELCSAKPTLADSDPWAVRPGEIPDYVLKYAPAVHLYSEEIYLPYHVRDYVTHFTATQHGKNITNCLRRNRRCPDRLKLSDLKNLPRKSDIYLTAVDEFDGDPDWITGLKNLPDPETHRSDAPAILIVVDRGNGVVDAFWFYFYSFNLGPFVMGAGPYGNHIGDWEHSLTRFRNGVPEIVWMSAHGGGIAYYFDALEKMQTDSNRPLIYSARGTHANYGFPGKHPHDIPYSILDDFTDKGPLWDPQKNFLGYTYDGRNVHTAVTDMHDDDGGWLLFPGHWGDMKLAPEDPRQKFHPFEWRFIDGPTGPLTKNLFRTDVCQRSKWYNIIGACIIHKHLNLDVDWTHDGLGLVGIWISRINSSLLRSLLKILLWKGWMTVIIDKIWG
ncbi:hypothetical protein CANCADRAFT_132337 [Tortispora caseinolytica NRRL Y-17796]|uniref:Vacuolar protein sorting-associated protein 62 n=1 Tax=Tortispora caseinolytica NRRL Y-17796 TaxID=767744 RepID=A0A1E4TB42_9ASCO|nr:hypothetical protein CANCADRAFT_132337 [Tortispora caseinolytica NRRL Y-17796]